MSKKNIFNPELIGIVKDQTAKVAGVALANKQAFVDPAAAGGGGDPAAMGGDPAAMGGDPAAMGGDPAAMGGAPAADPMAGGGGGDPMAAIQPMIDAAVQQAMAGQGGAAGAGGAEPIKPKIDVNVEIMQMKKLLARMADSMGIQIPAADMVATSDDLTQMGMQEESVGGGGAAGPAGSAIAPPEPIQAAMPMGGGEAEKAGHDYGRAVGQVASLRGMSNRASAMLQVYRANAD